MSRGILFIMSGPSGTGKGTICTELLKRRTMHLSVSTTSREQRRGEVPGVSYNYITEDDFKKLIAQDKMLEWAVYNGKYYGTPKDKIEEILNAGTDVLLEIEVQGAMQVKAKMPDAVLIFVVPPTMQTLRQRLIDRRRETEEEIEARIKASQWEFSQAPRYNSVVVNDNLEECVGRVIALMNNYRKERQIIEDLLNE